MCSSFWLKMPYEENTDSELVLTVRNFHGSDPLLYYFFNMCLFCHGFLWPVWSYPPGLFEQIFPRMFTWIQAF